MNIDDLNIDTPTGAIPGESPAPVGFVRKWTPLLVMSLALVIMLLDTTILNVTMRTIILDLDTTLQSFQWVITSYSLMLASFTITGGRLGDIFGRKRMFVLGAIIFAIGSVITSMSHGIQSMIIGEAIIEGIGAALMLPATATLLRTSYEGHDRRLAFGVWGGIAAAAAALGPLIGGWLTTNYSWRWAFRINVVVVAFLLLGSVLIKETRARDKRISLDYIGVLRSATGLFCLVFGFIEASTYGWWFEKKPFSVLGRTLALDGYSVTPVFVLVGIAILSLFALWEHRVQLAGRAPLVSLGLFRNSRFVTGTVISAIVALGQAGLTFSIPVYLQAVLKLDPIHTGLALIPLTLTILVAAPFSAFISRFAMPKRVIQLGILADAAGFLVLRHSLEVGASPMDLAPGLSLFGLGIGLMIPQTSNLALSAVSTEGSGEASGVHTAIRLTGATLGAAILGAIMISALGSNLMNGIADSAIIPEPWKPAISKSVHARMSSLELGTTDTIAKSKLPQNVQDELHSLSNLAVVDAGRTSLTYGALFVLGALAISFNLPSGTFLEIDRLSR